MKSIVQATLFALLCAVMMGVSTPAQAKGVIFYGYGPEVYDVGDFPESIKDEFINQKQLKVGLMCKRFSLFWANVWTWDCEFVGTRGAGTRDFYTLPPEIKTQVESSFKHSDAKRGFWNKYAFWTIVGLILAFFAVTTFLGRNSNDSDDGEAAPEIGSARKE